VLDPVKSEGSLYCTESRRFTTYPCTRTNTEAEADADADGAEHDAQYFDCWADGVATNILMPHYNCRDGQQAQQSQRMRFQPQGCATASLNPVKLITYLQVRVCVS
jgi:hypothetical protein